MLIKFLNRLAEMFPKQAFQTRLEQYILSRYPQSAADVELFCRDYMNQQRRGWL